MRLLIVDDNRDAADSLAGALKLTMAPECVAIAYDGIEAVEAVRGGLVVDVIVTDVEMPRLNGIGAARRIRDILGKEAPMLIAVTGNSNVQHEPAARIFDRVLMKPVDLNVLMQVLASAA